MKSEPSLPQINSLAKLKKPIPHFKIQNIGILTELAVLLLITGAVALPQLLFDDESPNQATYVLINFYIFGANFLLQLVLSLVKQPKTVYRLRLAFRVVAWFCIIANITENQVMKISSALEVSQKMPLAYSCLGMYIFVLIQELSVQNELIRKAAMCLGILYTSLRIAIPTEDAVLGIFGVLLCSVNIGFPIAIKRFQPKVPPPSEASTDQISIVLKRLLLDVEEGFIVLQQGLHEDQNILYANQKAYDLLDSHTPSELIANLEQVRRFDTLSDGDQATLKNQILDAFSGDKDPDEAYRQKTSFSFLKNNHSEKSLEPRDSNSNYTLEINNGGSRSGFHRQRSPSHYKKMTSRKTLVNDSPPSYSDRKLISLRKGQSSTLKNTLKSQLFRASSSKQDQKNRRSSGTSFNFPFGEEQTTTKHNTSYNFDLGTPLKSNGLDSLLHKNNIEPSEEVFKEGVLRYLNQIPKGNKPRHQFSMESSVIEHLNFGEGTESYLFGCMGYSTDSEGRSKLLSLKTQQLNINGKVMLVVRMKDEAEKEHYISLKAAEREKINMLSSVTHELRAPLSCIITMLDFLGKSISNDLNDNYVKPAIHSGKLLLNLINDILDYSQSRAQTLKFTYSSFNIRNHLIDVLKLMDLKAKAKGLELIFDYDERGPNRVYSEPNRLRQIIINLIGNALKFTFKGSITLKVEYIDPNIYRISVSDTGVGIKPEDLGSLFRQFSKINDTSHINQQGVGLGLSISNMLAKMLGPNTQGINVRSTHGHGTTFSFDLESRVSQATGFEHELSSDEEGSTHLYRNFVILKEQTQRPHAERSRMFQRERTSPNAGGISQISGFLPTITAVKEEASMTSIQLKQERNQSLDPLSKFQRDKGPSFSNLLALPSGLDAARPSSALLLPKTPRTLQSVEVKTLISEAASSRSKGWLEDEDFLKKIDNGSRTNAGDESKEPTGPWVLVVDDNEFNIIALRRIIVGLNYQVDAATNGDAAIQKILDRKERSGFEGENVIYKMILMDCQMPIKDGYQTTKEIRELEAGNKIPRIPIIAVTASTCQSDIKKCQDAGMDDYVPKPVTPDLMKDLINKHIKETQLNVRVTGATP